MSYALIFLSFLFANENESKNENEDTKKIENESNDGEEKDSKKEKRTLPESSMRDRENFDDYFLEDPFFRLPGITIPVIKDHELFANVFIRLEGEATSKNVLFKLRPLIPYITNQIFLDMYHLLAVFWLPETPLNSKDIALCAKNSIEKILGKNTIKKILTRDFHIQYY